MIRTQTDIVEPAGVAKPSFIISHEINIGDAPTAYQKFDQRIEGYTKVLIHPNGSLE
jgi:threonine dehydrogenase-like Zn-dependent dehydrogenase